MPQEPYYEILAYYEAGKKSVEVPAALVSDVGQAASGIVVSVLTGIAGTTLDSLKSNVLGFLKDKYGLADALPDMKISDIPSTLQGEIATDYQMIIDSLKAGIGQGVGSIHASMYEQIIGTNIIMSSYYGLLQRIGIDPYLARAYNQQFLPNIPDDRSAWFMHNVGALDDDNFKAMMKQNGWSESWLSSLDASFIAAPPIPLMLDMRRRGYIDDDAFKALLRWHRLKDDNATNVLKLVEQKPEPYRLAEIHSKGLATNAELTESAAWFGLSADWALRWSEAQRIFPNIDVAMTLYRRGLIDKDTFYYYMQRNQMAPEETDAVIQLATVIPPIQDLIRFAVREAYGDHDPEKQLKAMIAEAKLMGLSETAAGWYWYSHWERIPVNLMFANYHRGLWNKDKLAYYLKLADVHPDDRDAIISVAYNPPSIREMGYGFDVGVYTPEDITRFRRFGGLSPEDAEKATEAMIAYRTEAERNSLRVEYVYAYSRDALTEEQLTKKLTDLPTPEQAIPLWVERAKLYKDRVKKPIMDTEGKQVSSTEALSAFRLGLRDEKWAREALLALDWTPDRIDVAIAKTLLDIQSDTEKAQTTRYRQLTLAQLKDLYQFKLLSEEQLTVEIVGLGYNPQDAEYLTETIVKPSPEAAVTKPFTAAIADDFFSFRIFDEEDVYDNFKELGWEPAQAAMLTMLTLLKHEYPLLRTQYQNGVITGDGMVIELIKLGVPDTNALALVQETYRELQIQRLKTEKDLTKAEIIKGAKTGVISTLQAVNLLVGIGYDENEAYYILAINKVVTAGDPEGYWEMRQVTERYKKAAGQPYVDIPDELILLERQQKQLQAQLAEAKKHPENEQAIADLTVKLGAIETQMKQIIISKKLK